MNELRKLSILFSTLMAFTILVAFTIAGSHVANAESLQAEMPPEHAKLFQAYCYECHDSASAEGNMDLEAISFQISRDIPTADRWSKILNVINSGEMPPEDSEPIPDSTKSVFLEALSNQMVIARKVLSDTGGEIALRRLNRREYANTVESLLGVQPDVSNLPDDQAISGFDTQGASLFVSSDQLEQYLAVAKRTLELAMRSSSINSSINSSGTSPNAVSKVRRVEPEEEYTPHYADAAAALQDKVDRANAWADQSTKPASEFGFLDEYAAKKSLLNSERWLRQLNWYLKQPETQTGVALIMTIKNGGYTRVKLPVLHEGQDGKYIVRLRAAAYPGVDDRFQYVEFTSGFGTGRTHLGWRKVTGTLDEPQVIEFPVEHFPGEKKQIWIHQRSHQDRGDKNLWTIALEENGMGMPPGVWIDWAEIEGPNPSKNPGPSFGPSSGRNSIEQSPTWTRQDLESCTDELTAARVLESYALMAFRGATPDTEYIRRLVARFASKRQAGASPIQAMIDPLSIVLSSPRFLYMMESESESERGQDDVSGTPFAKRRLSDRELAVRLAYFLWSTAPDDQLMSLARDGRLFDPAILREQTERMLGDARSDRFVESFTYQWLEMHRLDMFQFDGVQFPEFDNAVRANARQEVFAMVRRSLDERLPLSDLLKSDVVVVNDVMADYYGISSFEANRMKTDGVHGEQVQGHEFRAVSVGNTSTDHRGGTLRGGLLGTAAVMAMGSDGQRSSPVERGAWVLRHLLNDPPPPAPPNVPQLSRLAGEVLSARELGNAHQEQPQCANCHRKIDPIGFGLENFDAVGKWRDVETLVIGRRKKTKTHNFAIDPSGRFPDGETFADFFELRDAIASRSNAFARGLTESLISYGLGRPYGFSDQDLADEILNQTRDEQYALGRIIHALVQSRSLSIQIVLSESGTQRCLIHRHDADSFVAAAH